MEEGGFAGDAMMLGQVTVVGLYWKDASLNTFEYCVRGMHLSTH